MAAGDCEVNVTTMNGKYGNLFDGVNDYVLRDSEDNFAATDTKTISVWVKPNADGVDTYTSQPIIQIPYFRLHIRVNNQINARYDHIGSAVVATYILNENFRDWVHIVAEYSNNGTTNTVKLYVDGDLKSTINNVNDPADAYAGNTQNIGRYASIYFNGSIAKVKIWNKVLTPSEIALDYAGRSTATDNLIFNMPLGGDYANGTNNGSIPTIAEDAVAAAIKADRTTANDKYLLTAVKGQIVSGIIEEAP